MLWNTIYNFYVQHVFGGMTLEGGVTRYYDTYFSRFYNGQSNTIKNMNNVIINVLGTDMSFANYLTVICTFITIVAIILFCVFIIKKIIGIIFRLFTGSSSF